ncbi:MAG: hypothetical protein CM15mP84_07830 [Cellvibrionales bacterium]|nr:MAG: hypothetical protein CM15mP84_07830 [Cellvibrionales bacterium]
MDNTECQRECENKFAYECPAGDNGACHKQEEGVDCDKSNNGFLYQLGDSPRKLLQNAFVEESLILDSPSRCYRLFCDSAPPLRRLAAEVTAGDKGF